MGLNPAGVTKKNVVEKLNYFFRNAKPFSQLVGLLFMLVAGFMFSTALMMLIGSDMDTPSQIRLQLVGQCLSQMLIFLLPALVFAWCYKEGPLKYMRLEQPNSKWVMALVGVVIFILMLPLNDWLSWWNKQFDFGSANAVLSDMSSKAQATLDKMLSLTTPGDLALQLFVVALIPAICEEVFFRGALQQILRDWFGNQHVAVVVTALVFTLAHGDFYGLVPRFVLGLLLGYFFFLSGSMLVNITAHFANNAFCVVMYHLYNKGQVGFNPSDPMLMPESIVVSCSVAAALLLVVYFVKLPQKNSLKIKR